MRCSILGFNQQKLIELQTDIKLDMTDILLMDYIQKALSQPSMLKIFENGQSYVWLNHKKILEDLPILDIKDSMLIKRLNKLINLNLISTKTVANQIGQGSRTYYTITNLFESLQYIDDNETRCKKLQLVEEPDVKNYIPYNNLDNNTIKTIKTTDNFLGSIKTIKQEGNLERVEKFLELYNSFENLPAIRRVSDVRKKNILKTLDNFTPEEIKTVLNNFNTSDFLLGKVSDFKANLDWILNENNFIKILEGKYNNHSSGIKREDAATSISYTDAELREIDRANEERRNNGLRTEF